MLKRIEELIKQNNIDDFYSVGYVDNEEGRLQYHPDLRFLYLKINSKYIEFESIEQYSKLSMKIVEKIEYPFKDLLEDELCISSIGDIILVSTEFEENKINRIIFTGLEEETDKLICQALELIIKEQSIFLDPGFLTGIGVGGIEQKQYWKDNFEERILPRIGIFPTITCLELN